MLIASSDAQFDKQFGTKCGIPTIYVNYIHGASMLYRSYQQTTSKCDIYRSISNKRMHAVYVTSKWRRCHSDVRVTSKSPCDVRWLSIEPSRCHFDVLCQNDGFETSKWWGVIIVMCCLSVGWVLQVFWTKSSSDCLRFVMSEDTWLHYYHLTPMLRFRGNPRM